MQKLKALFFISAFFILGCQSASKKISKENEISQQVSGKNPKAVASTFMSLCARGSFSRVEEYFLRHPNSIFEIDLNGDTVLNYALHSKDNRVFPFLLDNGAVVESRRKDQISVLMQAISLGKKPQIDNLIAEIKKRNKLNLLNAKNEFGWTALFYTVSKQDLELAEELVSLGADPKIKDKDGKTVLDYAGEDLWMDGIVYFSRLLKQQD